MQTHEIFTYYKKKFNFPLELHYKSVLNLFPEILSFPLLLYLINGERFLQFYGYLTPFSFSIGLLGENLFYLLEFNHVTYRNLSKDYTRYFFYEDIAFMDNFSHHIWD
jgi:hypothetical protein